MPVIKAAVAALVAASLLAGGVVVSSCGSAATDPAATGSAWPGRDATTVVSSGSSAAPQFSGVTLDGKTVTLDQYRGKPLFLVYMTSG
jgi:cytochrome oxidase Cu insertion factor (SCO1/SenC/PrrC family)